MDLSEVNSSSLSQLKFYNEYKDLAYHTVKKYLKDDFDIDDVVQSGFMKIFNKPEYINITKNLKGYLYMIFKNSSIDYIRKKKYTVEYIDSITGDIVEGVEYKQDMLSDIETEMNKLSPMYHLVFKCYHIENMTHKDISEKLGICEGTSKSNLHKATKRIQNKLKDRVYE
jgi:RNA polymerase sigma-70 factor (ECF subfamily)